MSKLSAATSTNVKYKPKTTSKGPAGRKLIAAASSTTVKPGLKKPIPESKNKLNDDKDSTRHRNTDTNTTKVATIQKTKSNTTTVSTRAGKLVNKPPKETKVDTKLSNQPARAKNTSNIVDSSRRSKSNTTTTNSKPAKPNAVLDSFHNVTVSSPPPIRKTPENNDTITEVSPESNTRTRTRTRTLDPDEVVVLRNESAKQRIEAQIQADNDRQKSVRDSVAFEVNFESPQKSRDRSRSRANLKVEDENEFNYSDDFESYESDFETGSSSPSSPSTENEEDDSNGENEDEVAGEEGNSARNNNLTNEAQESYENEDDDDESDLTQYPVTVIQRDKDMERKLDSGNYEINSRKQGKLMESVMVQQQPFDSLDTFSGTTSEQLDSGISYGNLSQQAEKNEQRDSVFYGGYAAFNTRPVLSTRGLELMSKIQFDTLTFTLFDLKPISYDVYMQTYGKLNTTQSSTQTNDNCMTTDCQTDDYEVRTMWTQHPPQYDLQTIQQLGIFSGITTQNCCGELTETNTYLDPKRKDQYDSALQSLFEFRQSENTRNTNQQLIGLRKPIDFDKLHLFLLKTSALVMRVLNSEGGANAEPTLRQVNKEMSDFSVGSNQLNTKCLNALRVIRIFGNAKHNLIITVHESLPEADVYRSDFSNLLMVWSTSDCSKPLRLLSAWSEVCRAEICNEAPDIIVCGLRDGSVALWDLRETYSFCSKLDGHLTHFAATQSIVPLCNDGIKNSENLIDLGAVVDVKGFRSRPKTIGTMNSLNGYKSIQFATLNDTGILTVWTLVETTPDDFNFTKLSKRKGKQKVTTPTSPGSRFEYSSPWARVKLIQSAICDLRGHLEGGVLKAQSSFDRTKLLFEKNIYKDEVLRELNDTNIDLTRSGIQFQGLRFTCIDAGCELIYVCTNRNFILVCSKSLKTERFRRIAINESRFLFPTALRLFANEDFLAVGLSNGSVMILNCNQNRSTQRAVKSKEEFLNKNPASNNSVRPETRDIDLETGKSCAIQNIILNERRSFDNAPDYDSCYEQRPTTAACIDLITNKKKPFELRVFDQQILLSGSMLRKHLVQSLELSSDGWRIFALSNGEVRVYDFYLDQEIISSDSQISTGSHQKILDMAVAKTSAVKQNLILLSNENFVDVHILKQ